MLLSGHPVLGGHLQEHSPMGYLFPRGICKWSEEQSIAIPSLRIYGHNASNQSMRYKPEHNKNPEGLRLLNQSMFTLLATSHSLTVWSSLAVTNTSLSGWHARPQISPSPWPWTMVWKQDKFQRVKNRFQHSQIVNKWWKFWPERTRSFLLSQLFHCP